MRYVTGIPGQFVLFPKEPVSCSPEQFFSVLPKLGEERFAVTVWCESEAEIEDFFFRALIFGARILSLYFGRNLARAFVKSGGTGRCMACGKPSRHFRECSCGTFEWCAACEEAGVLVFWKRLGDKASLSAIYWDHADHMCDPECCARGHTLPHATRTELEAMVPRIETAITDLDEKSVGGFSVAVRARTPGERAEDLACLLETHHVTG